MNMEQVFETLKVQSPSSGVKNSPRIDGNFLVGTSSNGNLRRSQNSTGSMTPMRKSNGERRKSGYSVLTAANQNQQQVTTKSVLSTSPIDILFKSTPSQQGNAQKRRISNSKPTTAYRENASPTNTHSYITNQRSTACSPNYAGPKFSEAPSPRALPFPPLHWLQANNSAPSVKVQS